MGAQRAQPSFTETEGRLVVEVGSVPVTDPDPPSPRMTEVPPGPEARSHGRWGTGVAWAGSKVPKQDPVCQMRAPTLRPQPQMALRASGLGHLPMVSHIRSISFGHQESQDSPVPAEPHSQIQPPRVLPWVQEEINSNLTRGGYSRWGRPGAGR